MQSWILAFALVLAAGGAWAEEPSLPAPDAVPPIPAPGEPMEAVAPLDGPWPAAPDDGVGANDAGSPGVVPPIPGPPMPEAPVTGAASGADATATEAAAATPAPARARPPFDPAGTIHVVEKGDTLWDISDLYLGTPWIWPSVWRDNEDIENPHLILPGDKIWVSANEMRKVSDEEAAALLAARDADLVEEPLPAAMAEDAPSVPMPQAPPEYYAYPEINSVGLVRDKELKGYAQIVGTTEEQVFLAQGDVVFIDLGQEDTAVGDEFTIFRTSGKVYDPGTRRVLGHHTEMLGWLEVTEVYDSTARARVRMAYADLIPGSYLRPREVIDPQIEIKKSPPGVEGQLADLLIRPKYNAGGDIVVLNRGSEDGLEVGSPLEVYRPVSELWKETWYGRQPDVEIPHEVVAHVLVISVQPHSAMAYVRQSKIDLEHGDRFRTVDGPSVEWPEGGLFVWPRVKALARRLPVPDAATLSVPGSDTVSSWNLPRLLLPDLDGYDPR